MKIILQIIIVCGLAYFCGSFTMPTLDKKCSNTTYLCISIRTAKSCRAVAHCIQTVWERKNIPKDTGPICKLCLDMVDEARNQLESNETITEIEQVFDGSCELMPFKIVKKECKDLSHQFILELIDTLESEMSSQMVCATAGFCNNAKIDKMLLDQEQSDLSCARCRRVGSIISTNIQGADQDDILEGLLSVCGLPFSFSDACSSIVTTNFDMIYRILQRNVTPKYICKISGDCSDDKLLPNYEFSAEIFDRIRDDIPCELCEQYIHHLKDLLIANTTELEFKHILKGLCKQTHTFSTECVSIVDQYYAEIYELITKNLDANGMCFMIGVCPKQETIPFGTVSIPSVSLNKKFPSMNGKYCVLCEYISHIAQEAVDQPSNEGNIKKVVLEICHKLPKAIKSQCGAFVKLYGDSLISLLSQELGSKLICPELKLCPKNIDNFLPDVGFMFSELKDNKSTCPLCLFAIMEAQQLINTTKTKTNIENVLGNLCLHLSIKMQKQCNDFVVKYSSELIEMLISDFTPQEICVYLKLCIDKKDDFSFMNSNVRDKDSNYNVLTNTISDNTIFGLPKVSLPQCELCKEIIRIVEKQIVNKNSKAEILKELENSCIHLKKNFAVKCKQLVDKYADAIIDLIQAELTPEEICHDIVLCDSAIDPDDDALIVSFVEIQSSVSTLTGKDGPPCIMCEFIMTKLDTELKDKNTDEEIKHTVKSICGKLPNTISQPCSKFIDQYADMIILLIDTITPAQMCHKLKLCTAPAKVDVAKNDVVKCGICEGIVTAFDHILSDPTVDIKIERIEERACQIIPGKYYAKCAEIIDIYGYSIINLIKSITNNDEICFKIGICYKGEHSGFVELL